MALAGQGLPAILIFVLAVPILLLTLFPLLGSTTPSLSSLYILRSSGLTIGYYGVCILFDNASAPTTCLATTAQSASSLAAKFGFDSTSSDSVVRGLQFALDLQRGVFVAFMTAGGLAWLISFVLVVLILLGKGGSGSVVRTAAGVLAGLAAVLMVASSWATSQSVAALIAYDRVLDNSASPLQGGKALQGLQWAAAILTCVYSWAVGRVGAGDGDKYTYNLGRR